MAWMSWRSGRRSAALSSGLERVRGRPSSSARPIVGTATPVLTHGLTVPKRKRLPGRPGIRFQISRPGWWRMASTARKRSTRWKKKLRTPSKRRPASRSNRRCRPPRRWRRSSMRRSSGRRPTMPESESSASCVARVGPAPAKSSTARRCRKQPRRRCCAIPGCSLWARMWACMAEPMVRPGASLTSSAKSACATRPSPRRPSAVRP